jgi:hypothetical protein
MKSLGIRKRISLLFVVYAYLAGGADPARAQKTPAAGPAPAAPAAPNAAPAGITNGSLPIESTILAYKVLVADAAKIDQCASSQSKTHQEQCILKSSLTSGSNFSVALNGQTRRTSS